jgi:hypothetical protein
MSWNFRIEGSIPLDAVVPLYPYSYLGLLINLRYGDEMLMKKRVEALTIKSGPTESGVESVGGDVLSIDKLSLLLSRNWLLILLLLLPLTFLFYKKRRTIFSQLLRRLRLH